MSVKVTNNISSYLSKFTEELQQTLSDASKEIAEAGASELQRASPKRTGKYSQSWRVKKTKNGYVIHNKDRYRLTHLLEKGHAKRNGGRTSALIHIEPVEKKAIEIFENKIVEILGG